MIRVGPTTPFTQPFGAEPPRKAKSVADPHLWIVHSPDPRWVDACVPIEGPLLIGRDPGDDGSAIALADEHVSREHARFSRADDRIEVADCGSRNGTLVNGAPTQGSALRAGDVVRIGNTVVVLSDGAPDDGDVGHGLVGRSPALRELRRLIGKVAPSALPVLLQGATGTGKELVSRALQAASGRSGRFVALNSAAIPQDLVENMLFGHRKGAYTHASSDEDGAFVRAAGGTLLLDEIGELSLAVQPKLLRALESGEILPIGAGQPTTIDARVIAATNRSLEEEVRGKRFRADLFARLAGAVIELPTLAARREDVLRLWRHFLPPALRARPMSAQVAEALVLYDWPMNVRELRQLAERVALLHGESTRWEIAMLPPALRATLADGRRAGRGRQEPSTPPTPEELNILLAQHHGNVSEVARSVGRNRKQVYRWMDAAGMPKGSGRTS